jgi:RNA recognition motif-containing protein
LKKIFAGNLDTGIAQESIGEALDKFGAVERMNLVRDREKGARRGFSFMEMTASEAWTA